ncbi:hypothetical protein [Streptosporangium sp. NPDC002524]|uniref:hypothetical protein n=1 Tax=Streptosporangium sp. NPDC002524 TaxID=3154537 RepID=UPI0033176F5B
MRAKGIKYDTGFLPGQSNTREEGVDTALWFTFAGFGRIGEGDLASYGVVRMIDRERWVPKEVFHTMAARYARGRTI